MPNKRIYLAAALATAPAAAAVFTAVIASPSTPPTISADNIHVNVDYGIPDINVVPNVAPDIHVPNINSVVNPGHVGLPGRGR
ncbi:hypothetical protein JDV09_17850 [Mycobacterium sp. Y57]|uniref:hypothetical protein n=1 Tax=Mycolicibacterium xanthum TaxID=2796469 RepID=UPI001C85ED28|nr:hypothetical protein [Mycolicibacterium xanthum]MBX7433960.1 hypothetical protein [Mycolicibacterium xanthum]